MAVYNELQVGRYVRFFQKFFGMKGRAPAPLTFSGEIGAHVPLFHGVENRYFEGWAIQQGYAAFTASVGNLNAAQVRNPPNSNIIGVLEKIRFLTQTTDTAFSISAQLINSTAALDFGTPSRVFPWDNRPYAPQSAPGSSILMTQTQAVAPANLGAIWVNEQVLANTVQEYILFEDQEIPLLPGVAIRFVGGVANINQQLMIRWRERFLEDSERS